MQQGKIDYKKEGINSLKYNLISLSTNNNVTTINVEL
jgi:hypothetical protein